MWHLLRISFRFQPLYSLENCQNHRFCSECFTEEFRSRIEDQNKHADLKCPEFGCEVKPTDDEILQAVGKTVYLKFVKFQEGLKVVLDDDTFFCGTPDCSGVLVKSEAKNDKIKCKVCKKSFCPKCKQPSHGKKSCDKNLDKKFASALGGVQIHQCPKCSCSVQKDGGCPEMQCGVCGYQWCWTCGFPKDSWFHKLQFGVGILCIALNHLTFGFDVKIHWFFRIFISIGVFILMPVFGIIGFTIFYFAEMGGSRCIGHFNPKGGSCCCWIVSLPFLLIWYVFVLTLVVAVNTIIMCFLIIPLYVIFILIIFIAPIRFFCCSKRK